MKKHVWQQHCTHGWVRIDDVLLPVTYLTATLARSTSLRGGAMRTYFWFCVKHLSAQRKSIVLDEEALRVFRRMVMSYGFDLWPGR